jgi:hypothetical protein
MVFIYAFLIAIGFLPFAIIVYKMKRLERRRLTWTKTMATVREIYGFSYRSINIFLIEFTNPETKETITKKIPVAGLPYAIGETLPIIYNPQNPRKILLDAGKKSFTGMMVFTLLIAAFIIKPSTNATVWSAWPTKIW